MGVGHWKWSLLILLNYMCDSKLDNICILIYWLKMIEMA